MAYATVDELGAALHLNAAAIVKNTDLLASCLAAAVSEIDHSMGRVDPLPDPVPELVVQVNVARGVEWYKLNEAVWGGVGYADVGILPVKPDSFARHAVNLIPLTQTFGVA